MYIPISMKGSGDMNMRSLDCKPQASNEKCRPMEGIHKNTIWRKQNLLLKGGEVTEDEKLDSILRSEYIKLWVLYLNRD